MRCTKTFNPIQIRTLPSSKHPLCRRNIQPTSLTTSLETLNSTRCANPAEEEIEGAAVPQQSVQVCTRSEAEMIMGMQHTYEEQQSEMGEMIRQVALLTVMIEEIQENRARSKLGYEVKGDGMTVTKGKSESLLDETGTGEIESDVEELQTGEESIITPSEDGEPQKTLNEARNKPPEEDYAAVKQEGGFDNAASYFQTKKVHKLDERVEEPMTTSIGKEYVAAECPPRKPKSQGENGREWHGPFVG